MNTVQNNAAPVSPASTGKIVLDWTLADKRDFVFPVAVTLVQTNRPDGGVSRTFRASLKAGTLIQPVLNPNDIPAEYIGKTGTLTVIVDRDPKGFIANDNGTIKINEPCTFKSFTITQ